jgi:AraC-like DNA-binding protein
LRSTRDKLNAVAAEAGYRSPAAFLKSFKRHMGITPGSTATGATDGRSEEPLISSLPRHRHCAGHVTISSAVRSFARIVITMSTSRRDPGKRSRRLGAPDAP